ncbi:TIM barrel protein [Sphingomonas sp. 1P06PA]|uniref:sugar phosphate isomerase/epimerase family protein n=1 Tax=Sphingomonas sp. 1P06PA TaxID=554121 RepID=UPI0039A6096F
MPRLLSLHPLNALDAAPIDMVRIAGRVGADRVCLFTHVPGEARALYPFVAPADVPAIRDALGEAGVALSNLEVFPLDRDGELDRFREGLETGAALGATKATAHIHEATFQQGVDRFAAFAELAESHGITAGLEFYHFAGVCDIVTAERTVRAAGRGSLVLDVLHLIRGGHGAREAAAAADLVGYAQLSDGPLAAPEDRWHECVVERDLPGEGEFPMAEILRSLGDDVVFEVEVPQTAAREAGVDAEGRARRSIEAARRTLAAVPWGAQP